MTKHIYILGYPVKDTAGGAVLQAGCDHLDLNIRCKEWELEDPTQLQKVVNYFRRDDVLGANVTMPYKESIIHFLDALDEETQYIKSVNTVFKRGGKLIGYNADAEGFLQALLHEGSFEPRRKRAVILGAGGTARSSGVALAKADVRSITIVNRTLSRATDVASILKPLCPDVQVIGYEDDRLKETIKNSELLVNCTPFGMKLGPLEGECPIGELIPKGQMVYDVVYKPPETPFLKMAREAGAEILNGLPMVVRGEIVSFRLFTNHESPVEVMFDAATKYIEKYHW